MVRLQAVQQFLGLVLADPELRRLVRLDDALREVCKALDLDPDQWLKSVQQLQQEAQTQQDVAAVLAAETQQAQTAKLKAEAVRAEAETAEIGERLKIDRARAVRELEEPQEAGRDAGAPVAE